MVFERVRMSMNGLSSERFVSLIRGWGAED